MPTSTTNDLPPTRPPLTIHTTVFSIRTLRRTLPGPVAFVPTMGALHAGHLSLAQSAAQTCVSVIVSIFVNPAQFAPHEDLAIYPRTLSSDISQLCALNDTLAASGFPGRVRGVFVPSVSELYPSGLAAVESDQRGAFVSVQPLASKLEGITRPHFFRGVATVCVKLFNIVQPDQAYFGQKDVQQCIVLRRVVKDLLVPVEIVMVRTGREVDGLAMSSRNEYLGERRRKAAPVVFKALKTAEERYRELAASGKVSAKEVRKAGGEVLDTANGANGVRWEVEYFSLADREELDELEEVDTAKGAVLSTAIKMRITQDEEREVRLIDNIILERV